MTDRAYTIVFAPIGTPFPADAPDLRCRGLTQPCRNVAQYGIVHDTGEGREAVTMLPLCHDHYQGYIRQQQTT